MQDSQSLNLNDNSDYNGLLKHSFLAILRTDLFNLFTYLNAIVPNFFFMHEIISIWRIVQFIGPSFCSAYSTLWNYNKAEGKVVSILSVFFHLVPVEYRVNASVPFELAYSAINIICCIVIIGSAKYYKITAILPKYLPLIMSIYIHTSGYLLHPVALNFIGEDLGRLFSGKDLGSDKILQIFSIIISFICFSLWAWFFLRISVVSFLFLPNSLSSVLSSAQSYFIITTYCITFLTALASQLSKVPSTILTIIAAIFYIYGIMSILTPGTFISSTHQRLIFAASITSFLFSFIFGVFVACGKKCSIIEIFLIFIIYLVIYIIAIFLHKFRLYKQMQMLDDYQNKIITIDDIKMPHEIINLGITALEYAHPVCENWILFRDGTKKWPQNTKIWVTFGKFVAIYPIENVLLSQIIYAMTLNKSDGIMGKQMIAEAKTIYTQREISLSGALKIKLNRSVKNVSHTKIKLRQVWDLAIQGSINEMESSITTAYNSVNKTRSYFNHLLSQYPNNRFVARSYLRFISEIENDPKKYSEWSEKVGLLHRGLQINPDHTNVLGFHAFPGLPLSISNNVGRQNIAESESFTNNQIETESIIDENNSATELLNDQISVIKDHIDHLTIPATLCIKIWNILLYLILIFLPSIILMIVLPKYLDSLDQSLHYMHHLSYLRSLTIQISVFANHFLNEKIGYYPQPMMNFKSEAYGYETETDQIIRYLLRIMGYELEQVSYYRSFKKDNEYVKPAHNLIFSGVINYTYFRHQKDSTISPLTLHGSLTDSTMQITQLIDFIQKNDCSSNPNDCWSIQNTTYYLNPISNYGVISDDITLALDHLYAFLENNAIDVQNISMFICLFACIVYALIFIGILVYQINSLQDCKKSIYKCLTSLPKNVISSISEKMKILNKNTDIETEKTEESNLDLNKQEENILKVFSSCGDASMKSLDISFLTCASLILLACALINICLLAFCFPKIASHLKNSAPHLDYIFGTSSYAFAVIGAIDMLILTGDCHGITGFLNYACDDPKSIPGRLILRYMLISYIKAKSELFVKYHLSARFGSEDGTVPPYSRFEEIIQNADDKKEGCADYNYHEGSPEYFSCYQGDIQINILKPLISTIIIPLFERAADRFDPHNSIYNQLWNTVTMGLDSKILYPMFFQVLPEMEKNLNKILPPVFVAVAFILIIAFIDLVFIILQIISSEKKMKFALSLLKECPPSIVLQNPKIMNIIIGNFSSKLKDSSQHNSSFFDSIVQRIPDSVIVCNSNFKILNLNKATERIYGINSEDIIDDNLHEFFTTSSKFIGNTKELFEKTDSCIIIEYKKNEDGNKSFLEISICQISGNYVVVTRDETQAVLYNTLIAEERMKSDSLLSSILPPNLVKRVQKGEKNISFSVQSASILFFDIVEFTPWCASNTAANVMSTLNVLFGKCDALLASHSTMTKIKCIGDCYMCSSGIFVEINQASVHAKETVEFGLEAISALEEVNKERNLTLRIRVGVNTGGPIVAGVLGTEKPTFEILGPAINMAQQMEHHGVPMKVHISRSTYELIYGSNFVIKERGQIEIKKGTVVTYLVESKK